MVTFSQLKGAKDGEIEVCYVLEMDPMGMIPQYVVNAAAPARGMEVEQFVKDWPKVIEIMKKREANQFKKDHEPMFDEPHPKLMYTEKPKENEMDKPLTVFKRPKDDDDDDQKEEVQAQDVGDTDDQKQEAPPNTE